MEIENCIKQKHDSILFEWGFNLVNILFHWGLKIGVVVMGRTHCIVYKNGSENNRIAHNGSLLVWQLLLF